LVYSKKFEIWKSGGKSQIPGKFSFSLGLIASLIKNIYQVQ